MSSLIRILLRRTISSISAFGRRHLKETKKDDFRVRGIDGNLKPSNENKSTFETGYFYNNEEDEEYNESLCFRVTPVREHSMNEPELFSTSQE